MSRARNRPFNPYQWSSSSSPPARLDRGRLGRMPRVGRVPKVGKLPKWEKVSIPFTIPRHIIWRPLSIICLRRRNNCKCPLTLRPPQQIAQSGQIVQSGPMGSPQQIAHSGQIAQSGLSANRDPILTGSPSSPTSSCSTTCSEVRLPCNIGFTCVNPVELAEKFKECSQRQLKWAKVSIPSTIPRHIIWRPLGNICLRRRNNIYICICIHRHIHGPL